MSAGQVVITGVGIVSAIGIGQDAYWDALLAGVSGIKSLAERKDGGPQPPSESLTDNAEAPAVWIGAPITDFEPKQFVKPRKALKVMCREIQFSFAASQMAIEDAGLAEEFPATTDSLIPPSRIGTVFGSEMFYGPPDEMLDAFIPCMTEGEFDVAKFGANASRKIMPLWMLKYLPNMPACHVGIAVGAHGPNNSLLSGDASGPAAVIESVSCIERGIADVVISGAAGTRLSTTRMNYKGNYPRASVTEPISRMSRPHADDADGVVAGEGAATLLLESAESAKRRGQTPLATIAGLASRFHSPNTSNGTPERGSGIAIGNAIDAALADADVAVADIGLIVSHGISDSEMDAAEANAILERLPECPVICPTAALGHTGAACGTIGLATGVLAIKHGTVAPTINATGESGIRLLAKPQPLSRLLVLCLSHTPEGTATAIVLRG